MKSSYDLIFVGAGISSTFTLINLLESIPSKPSRPWEIAVIERSNNIFKGIPYGENSSLASLIITPLQDFLPEDEMLKFISWIEANKPALLNRLIKHIVNLDSPNQKNIEEWYRANESDIEKNNWKGLCLPRNWFGEYLKERVELLIENAVANQVIKFEIIQKEVISANKEQNGQFLLKLTSNDIISEVLTTHLVLAIGSPPQRKLEPKFKPGNQNIELIEDAYLPGYGKSLDSLLNKLNNELVKERRNILIVGTNASALELIYHIRLYPEIVNKIFLLSTNAKLPRLIGEIDPTVSILSENMDQIKILGNFGPEDLYKAFKQDAVLAKLAEHNISNINIQLSKKMADLLSLLSLEDQMVYFERFGMKTTKIMRRAGKEYRLPLDLLIYEGKLELLSGRYKYLEIESSGKVKIYYTALDGVDKYLHQIAAVINCTGSELMNNTSSSLINSLYQNGLANYTRNLLGLQVNDKFEAHENFYVMGPLIAGNINSSINSWHVESAGRISLLSRKLAKILAEKLFEIGST